MIAVIILMGVAGSGKTSIGQTLKASLNQLGHPLTFYDADDFHSDTNRAKMAAGNPLTDSDRASWLETLAQLISEAVTDGRKIILACSALKHSYRAILVSKVSQTILLANNSAETGSAVVPSNCLIKHEPGLSDRTNYVGSDSAGGGCVAWFYLKGTKDVIENRLRDRNGHYFKPGLLDSQFAALEEPSEKEAMHLNISNPVEIIVASIEKVVLSQI